MVCDIYNDYIEYRLTVSKQNFFLIEQDSRAAFARQLQNFALFLYNSFLQLC